MKQISMIMATYNRAALIRPALESALQQAYPPQELIVIDDGSTDDTATVIQALIEETGAPIRYFHQPNRGQAHALNRGIELARGEIITFLDADDLWAPDRLPDQLAFFDAPPLTDVSVESTLNSAVDSAAKTDDIGIVLGRKRYFTDGVQSNEAEIAAANGRPFHFALGAALIARWVFDATGPFDASMPMVADWDWFARVRTLGIPMAVDPRVTLLVRIHGGNITQNRAQGARLTVEMIRRHMRRRQDQPQENR